MNNIKELLDRYLDGNCTATEQEQVETWLANQKNEDNQWHSMNDQQKEQWLSILFTDINRIIDKEETSSRKLNSYGIPLRRLLNVAAAILLVATASIWFYTNQKRNSNKVHSSAYNSDIAPGKNKATLTLADGKIINLSDAKTGLVIDASKITYNDGSKVQSDQSLRGSSGDPSLYAKAVTMSTPKGGTYQVILPDGTRVWLNAASSLKFPSNFNGIAERRVILNGEAYFEVAKDKSKPFIVATDKQEVEVLGTHFNINSYADEAIVKTTLLEGSVKVSGLLSHFAQQLKPGQQSVLTRDELKVQIANTKEVTAWKNGYFIFNDEQLGSIMRKLSRWYDVDIHFQDEVQNVSFIGVISREKNISSVLDLLEATGNAHFKIEGRRITVMK